MTALFHTVAVDPSALISTIGTGFSTGLPYWDWSGLNWMVPLAPRTAFRHRISSMSPIWERGVRTTVSALAAAARRAAVTATIIASRKGLSEGVPVAGTKAAGGAVPDP
ncbi:hypothetical protein [Amycolatopsis sp. cg13]|uniref:hypothetical protein n=1 Tax=Amycolatopsis sp. cg13 TaxID=3238807 RepID=UPI003523274B